MYSTENVKQKRFQLLASMDEQVFHRDDLARLWNIDDPNTLNVAIYRYVKNNLLYRIYKGFFSIKPPERIDPHLLGVKALHRYAYISTETVLFDEGIIHQLPAMISMVSSVSRKFTIGDQHYSCRKLKSVHLMNPAGIFNSGHCKKADVNRAVADMLYFNKQCYFDNENAIDWQAVRLMQSAIGYSETPLRYR
jgi:predicted transcriptional regulator of viral defense system